jgi:hypothetical protein
MIMENQTWFLLEPENKEPKKGLNLGTPARMLYRPSDPDTSKVAAEGVDTSALEEMVLNAIARYEANGVIADQILEEFPNYPYSSITARFSALIRKGLILDTGLRRKGKSGRGQRVMVAI